jgi:hypothetical protein
VSEIFRKIEPRKPELFTVSSESNKTRIIDKVVGGRGSGGNFSRNKAGRGRGCVHMCVIYDAREYVRTVVLSGRWRGRRGVAAAEDVAFLLRD